MLQFRIQSTPNPLARKYVLSKDLNRDGKVSYQQADQCQHVPLAHALMHVDGVTQVHFFENILTITQDGSSDWSYMDQAVQNIVTEQIDQHNIDFVDYLEQEKPVRDDLPPELQTIEKILDDTIRPSLQMDGGDVEPLDLEGNILTIRYMGACGGCPSSMTGTLEAIRHVLKAEFREDIEVVAI